jgi:hypothetical protein
MSVVGALVLGNIGYKLTPSAASREAGRLQRLYNAKKFTELLASINEGLQKAPASSVYLMFKVYALLGLGRIDEAERAAWAFKKATPERRPIAIDMIEFVTDLRSKLAQQHIPEHEVPALLVSNADLK